MLSLFNTLHDSPLDTLGFRILLEQIANKMGLQEKKKKNLRQSLPSDASSASLITLLPGGL
jgi:hypothetical protein